MAAVRTFSSTRPDWILRYHDTVRDAVEYGEEPVSTHGGQSSQSESYGDNWSGTDTYKTAHDLALKGWSDIRPNVDAILQPVREKLSELLDYVQEPFFDVTGFEPDIDRYLEGELECMREYVPFEAPAKGKVFTLLINGCYSCGASAKTVFAKGAAISALVEAMQILGFDLDIYVEATVSRWGYGGGGTPQFTHWTSLVHIHHAGEYLDINNIMFPMGSPGWLRRIVFSIMEQEPQAVRDQFGFIESGRYSSPADLQTDELVDPSFTMSMKDGRSMDVTDPVGWVMEQLEVQGVWNRED